MARKPGSRPRGFVTVNPGKAVSAVRSPVGSYPSGIRLASFGDSRQASAYLDGTQRNRAARYPGNAANAMLGHRLIIGQSYGVSGDRTDQLFARLPAVLASDADFVHVQAGVNNIAQTASSGNFTYTHAVTGEVVTIDTVAAVAARDLRQICDAIIGAGKVPLLENEVGASGLNTTEKVNALNALRTALAAYAATNPRVLLHDAAPIVMQTGTTTPTYKVGYSYDGTHLNGRGGHYWGKSLAQLLAPFLWAARVPAIGANDTPANGRRQLLSNHMFATPTGGVAGTGASGPVPAGWNASMSDANAGSVVLSTVANPDGIGNAVQAVITFAAAGSFRFDQALAGTAGGAYHANMLAGDDVQAIGLFEVVGSPTVLATAQLELLGNTGSGGANFGAQDMAGPSGANDQGVDEPVAYSERTRPTVVPAPVGANPYMTTRFRVQSTGAGQVTVIIRQIAVRRRNA